MYKERVALITGGTRGIGLSIARELLSRGDRVAVGSRDAGTDAILELKKQYPSKLMVLKLDVRNQESVQQVVQTIRSEWEPPSILVNSAGVSHHSPVCSHSEEDWLAVIDTNLNGVYRMVRATLPDMMKIGWGRIINIGSTAAKVAKPTHAAYCASKAGLVGLTRAVALEGAPRGVGCVAISPTWVETDMLHESVEIMAKKERKFPEEILAEIRAENPRGQLVQPEEIAALASFLASDACSALTMEDIQVNAGALW